MPLSISPGAFRRIALTLSAAVTGGALATFAGLPAGWLCGAAIVVAALALWRRDLAVPGWLLTPTYLVLGSAMGSTVEAGMLANFERPMISLLAILAAIVGVAAAGYSVFRAAGWERDTALYSAVPGALAQSVALADESPTADVPRVALAQTTRLLTLVLVVPLVIGTAMPAAVVGTPARVASGPQDLAILFGAAALGLVIARRLGFPAAFLTGPFFASLALHLSGLSTAHVPGWLTIPAYVAMGAIIGTRFGKADPALVLRAFVPILCANGAGLVVALLVARAASAALGVDGIQAFLAFAPGGIDSMAILALALHLDAAFVVLHQVARFLLLTCFLPVVARAFRRRTHSVS